MSSCNIFLAKLIVTVLLIITAYLPNNSFIKIVALISFLVVINFNSIKNQLYKNKKKDNTK